MLLTRRPADWTLRAPVTVRATREIAVSAADVFAVIADHEGWSTWFANVQRVVVTRGDGQSVGAGRRVTLRGGVTIDEEFLIWDPPRAFGFTVVAMRPRVVRSLNELVTVDDLGGARCRVTYHQGVDPRAGSAWLVRALARWILPKVLGRALASLERVSRG
jgi:uncharacterized protein YndB with AHSA1/START domain